MSTRRSADQVMQDWNNRAKAEGRYLDTSFLGIPESKITDHNSADRAGADERIRRVQEEIDRVHGVHRDPLDEIATNQMEVQERAMQQETHAQVQGVVELPTLHPTHTEPLPPMHSEN